jgi:hypothetical protein
MWEFQLVGIADRGYAIISLGGTVHEPALHLSIPVWRIARSASQLEREKRSGTQISRMTQIQEGLGRFYTHPENRNPLAIM